MSDKQSFMDRLLPAFEEHGVTRTFAKGEYLIREGDVERQLHLVLDGAVRVLYVTGHDEHIIRFGYRESIINSLNSFLKATPSEYFIEAIRKTTVKSISREALYTIVEKDRESQRQYIDLLETLVTQQMERELDLLTPSPLERLNRVLARSPHLFQEIPLKYIASYLRMTPETLSRIRNS